MSNISEKIIKPKLGVLELAKQLGNVSQACKIMGYSRDSFYRYKNLYEEGGEAALQEVCKKKPNIKNRIPEHIESRVISLALANPALGQTRAANELAQQGLIISPGGVRCIWVRNNLETLQKRLKNLEKYAAANGLVLTESQIQALEKAKLEKEAYGEIETEHPGYLGAQDTYYVGVIKGIGRIYQQTFIDTYSRVAFAQLYTEKTAITAAHILNNEILPWFEAQGVNLLRVLTDRGTEYCGQVASHAYQLFLAVENIDHSKTKARHPQTNGICERVNRTIKEEFYDIALRRKIYHSLEELQIDLNEWLKKYNTLRPHSGKYCYGKTPMQTFNENKHIAIEKNHGNISKSADSYNSYDSAA